MNSLKIGVLLLLFASPASATLLYDGSAGGSPSSQGWLFTFPTAFESVGANSTTYSTAGSNAFAGGYSNHDLAAQPVNPAFPVLDASAGFTLSIDLRMISEAHANNNRAGFSIILLDSNAMGVELGFFTNQIFAQNLDFTHGEEVGHDTTAYFDLDDLILQTYDLTILGSAYTLSANGTEILSGFTRDYNPPDVPYDVPNYIFIGDDTSSAQGAFEYSRLEIVPEPGTLGMLALGALAVIRRRKA